MTAWMSCLTEVSPGVKRVVTPFLLTESGPFSSPAERWLSGARCWQKGAPEQWIAIPTTIILAH